LIMIEWRIVRYTKTWKEMEKEIDENREGV
jgi:hypothetical protein